MQSRLLHQIVAQFAKPESGLIVSEKRPSEHTQENESDFALQRHRRRSYNGLVSEANRIIVSPRIGRRASRSANPATRP
jgi:hypothetical protein